MAEFTPEKSKQIALARLDIVHKWLEFRKKSQNKLRADYDFVKWENINFFIEYDKELISEEDVNKWKFV